ncbi:extracellular solute-binding protein [Nonomuraea ferruginea]
MSIRLQAACSEVVWAARLNVLWIVFTLLGGVVLGLGPATVAAYTLARRHARGESIHALPEFWRVYRREFVRASLLVLPLAVVATVLVGNLLYFAALGPGARAWQVATLVALVALACVGSYLGPLYAHYDLPLLEPTCRRPHCWRSPGRPRPCSCCSCSPRSSSRRWRPPPRAPPQRRRVDLPQHVAVPAVLRGERGAPALEREPMTASRRRRLAAGALTLTAALVASACSSGAGEGAAESDTLTMMVPLFQTAPDPKGEIQQAVEKLVGKKLQITWVPNAEYNDKTNVMLASNAIPDVVVIQDNKGASFVQAAKAGAFWDLTDKLDKYPNLKPKSQQAWINSKTDGRNYGIYRVRPLLRSAVVLRKDWLEKLDLEPPKTTDDLYEIAKAFTEKDPDGNGKKDTYGLILPKWPAPVFSASSPYNAIDVWFGTPNNYGMRDGKLVPEFDVPEFWEAQKYTKKFIDEGLVNPDWATLDTGKWNDPFLQGKGGIIIDVNVRAERALRQVQGAGPRDLRPEGRDGGQPDPAGRAEVLPAVHRLQRHRGDLQAARPDRGTARRRADHAGQAGLARKARSC